LGEAGQLLMFRHSAKKKEQGKTKKRLLFRLYGEEDK
jgi:hypothetical protein